MRKHRLGAKRPVSRLRRTDEEPDAHRLATIAASSDASTPAQEASGSLSPRGPAGDVNDGVDVIRAVGLEEADVPVVAGMNCPGCNSAMQHLELDGKLHTKIDVDLCAPCRIIWFDHFKDLQLTPAATLSLFGIISAPATPPAAPLGSTLSCPRCSTRLALTHDMQRATRFQYWRCGAGHGRLITFVDFLREKDFVRPLTPGQIDDLRQTVRTVNCGNCGAPIDLAKDSICAHCSSPVSILDPLQMARTIAQLQNAAAGRHADAAASPGAGPHPHDFAALMQAMKEEARSESPRGLIETGLRLLGDLLKSR